MLVPHRLGMQTPLFWLQLQGGRLTRECSLGIAMMILMDFLRYVSEDRSVVARLV
jgi:hypothetical protein